MTDNIITPASLSLLKKLWKDTFRDSDSYINLVFKRCFSPQFTITRFDGEKPIAALYGIPYSFSTGGDAPLRGLYLCGLATRPEYRRRGIMTDMLREVEKQAGEAGFDFTFLIPADDGLRRYYNDRGYVNGTYRLTERFTSAHDFLHAGERIKFEVFRLRNDNKNLKNVLAEYCCGFEKRNCSGITRSKEQFGIVIEENIISGGDVIYALDENSKIGGIAFISKDDEDYAEGEIEVRKIFYENHTTWESILQFIHDLYPDRPVELFLSPDQCDDRKALWQPYLASDELNGRASGNISPAGTVWKEIDSLKPYAMFRLLRRVEVESRMVEENRMKAGAADGLSDLEFAEIIWRRPVADKLVDESLQIGWLPSDVSLMLD